MVLSVRVVWCRDALLPMALGTSLSTDTCSCTFAAAAFVGIEAGLDQIEFDKHIRLPGNEYVTPIVAAALTGAVYRSAAGIPVAFAAGAVGAVAGAAFFLGVPYLKYQFGDDIPLLRMLRM